MAPQNQYASAVASLSRLEQLIAQYGKALGVSAIDQVPVVQRAARHLIYTQPAGKDQSNVWYDGGSGLLLKTRQPLLDVARILIAFNCDRHAWIIRRRLGSDVDQMWAKLGEAAHLSVDNTKSIFVSWKPFPLSAVAARNASSAEGQGSPPFQDKATGQFTAADSNREPGRSDTD